MYRHGRVLFLSILMAGVATLAACNEGGGGELAFFELGSGSGGGRQDLPDLLTFCCDDLPREVATIFVAARLDEPHATQFSSNPHPDARYLAFSLRDVSPPDALEFRWTGAFVADGRRNENAAEAALPFDPDEDVGEISTPRSGDLEISATRCDFGLASFTMVVLEFSYVSSTPEEGDIVIHRTQEREIRIENECATPPPPPPGDPADLIVFSNSPPDTSSQTDAEIWVMDGAGGNAAQLTHNTREDWDPAWSPDRTQIAFVSNSQGAGTNLDLMVMDYDGVTAGAPTPLTTFDSSGGLSARDPAWSPLAGDRRIACAVGANGSFDEIWVFDLRQPAAPPLRIDAGALRDVEHPAWDGREIIFCNAGLTYVVPADGASMPTAHGAGEAWALDWGPSGLVLQRYANQQFRLVRTDAKGDGASAVTSGGAHAYDMTPSWSPMSDYVVFVRQIDENADMLLYTVVASGTNAKEIPGQPPGDNSEPDWGFGPLP